MRLGGPVFGDISTPEKWIAAVQAAGYRAAYCPVKNDASEATIAAYAQAARESDIVIAEVGAWSNPLSQDAQTRREAREFCKRQLELADRIGAVCCVNIAGSLGAKWDGPCAEDLTEAAFARIVESVQEIVDSVQPERAIYTLETMPWMYPDSPQSYLDLMRAIDRKSVAVHLDPVNLINSPTRYFHNANFLRECFALLGSQVVGVHAKDVLLRQNLTVHLDEVRPGLGGLDYKVFLGEMTRLPKDTPFMLEHLPTEDEYKLAAAFVRDLCGACKIIL
ncbi:TIM barrel protein [Armatimonas sp.]|uniref:sugar phosphate isomerase/epimerase family protein n=1 Tax=Armatimonas sp. TaxID=1872638 RepID=UPI00286C333A|nr:TIM barrel protein [Armatimonas sp.]